MNSSEESKATFPIDVNSPHHQAFMKKNLYVGFYKS